ncbi:MAG: hypothetical protein PHE17_18190 [Thiothrix sp.]|uniref:hypothetical protein n=1 Tax=Thiothrix sp. TaxID=1032 RepID=UPI002618A932|nr:hypothetical protein [Thiothrix sp.]MDD5394952.1 hypothetical protein [Thiothrix sp.]
MKKIIIPIVLLYLFCFLLVWQQPAMHSSNTYWPGLSPCYADTHYWKPSYGDTITRIDNFSPPRGSNTDSTDWLIFTGDSSVSQVVFRDGQSFTAYALMFKPSYTGLHYLFGSQGSQTTPLCTLYYAYIDSSVTGGCDYPQKIVFIGANTTLINAANNGTISSKMTLWLHKTHFTYKQFKTLQLYQVVLDSSSYFYAYYTGTASGVYLQNMSSSPMLVAYGSDTIQNESYLGFNFGPNGSRTLWSLPKDFVWTGAGAGGIHIDPYTDNAVTTMGWINYNPTAATNWSSVPSTYGHTIILNDSISWINNWEPTNAKAGKVCKFKTNGHQMRGGSFQYGNTVATGTFTLALDSAPVYVTDWGQYNPSTGGVIDSLGSAAIHVTGNWQMLNTDTIKNHTGHIYMEGTAAKSFTTGQTGAAHKQLYFDIDFALSAGKLLTQVNDLYCNNLKIKGKFTNGNNGDSCLNHWDSTTNATDTQTVNGTRKISGNGIFNGAAVKKWDTGTVHFCGTNAHAFVASTAPMGHILLTGTGSTTMGDSLNCADIRDSTTSATFSTNYGIRTANAWLLDSVDITHQAQLTGNLTFGALTRPHITTNIQFIGTGTSTFSPSGKTVYDVDVVKTAGSAANNLTLVGNLNTGTGDLTVTSGYFYLPAGDTARVTDATFNNAGDSVVLGAGAVILFAGNFSCAATVKFGYGAGAYIAATTCSPTITTNNNATFQTISYPVTGPFTHVKIITDTVGKAITGHTRTNSGCTADSLKASAAIAGLSFGISTGAWTGTPTTAGTYIDKIYAYNQSGGAKYCDSAAVDTITIHAGTTCTASPATGTVGTVLHIYWPGGLTATGTGGSIGGSALTSWVRISADSASAVSPAGSAGAAILGLHNSVGDSASAAWTYTSASVPIVGARLDPVSSRKHIKIYARATSGLGTSGLHIIENGHNCSIDAGYTDTQAKFMPFDTINGLYRVIIVSGTNDSATLWWRCRPIIQNNPW